MERVELIAIASGVVLLIAIVLFYELYRVKSVRNSKSCE